MNLLTVWDGWLNALTGSTGWGRLGLVSIGWLLLWLPLAIPIAHKLQWRPFQPLAAAQKLPLLGPLYLVAPLILWSLLQAEVQNWSHYGLTWNHALLTSTLMGLAIALASLMVVFGWEVWQGWIVWHPKNARQLLLQGLPILLLALWIGVTEEVIFRGCLQTELLADYGLWGAGAIASVIFALLHLVWERQQTLPQIPGLVLMGVVLTGATVVDQGQLGLAIGLHAGWVWGLTCIDAAQLIEYQESAPPWVVGWNQQPLAGLAGIICLLGTALGLLFMS